MTESGPTAASNFRARRIYTPGPMTPRPKVLFVCVHNAGKSQMAAGLMRELVDDAVGVESAGTEPAGPVNALSVQALAEVGADISGGAVKLLTPAMQQAATVVVTLGLDAQITEVPGPRYETWQIDEPSSRGIRGLERMRLVRDDIDRRVRALARELAPSATG